LPDVPNRPLLIAVEHLVGHHARVEPVDASIADRDADGHAFCECQSLCGSAARARHHERLRPTCCRRSVVHVDKEGDLWQAEPRGDSVVGLLQKRLVMPLLQRTPQEERTNGVAARKIVRPTARAQTAESMRGRMPLFRVRNSQTWW
jgi:hypothetical protein